MKASSTADAGFTLLEVLVALTLLSFVASLAYQGVKAGSLTWATVEQTSEAVSQTEDVRSLLQKTIATAYPSFSSNNRADRTVAFSGEAEALTLHSSLPAALANGVMGLQTLRVVDKGSNRSLVLLSQLDLPSVADNRPSPEMATELLDHVGTLRFRYYGASASGEERRWQEVWQNRFSLPQLVSISVEPDHEGRFQWPELVVELRRTANVSCAYDPADLVCRRQQ